LMTRAVFDAVGSLDERFHLGFFEDDDLAIRARQAGFELAVAMDLFVHHFGSRTFAGHGIDAEALLEENAQRFAAKWGHTVPKGQRVALRPWSQPAAGPPEVPRSLPPQPVPDPPPTGDQGPRARATLTVIARDEEKNLSHCLGSVQGLFDEI